MDKPDYAGVLLAVPCNWCNGKGRLSAYGIKSLCQCCLGSGGRPKLVSFEEFVDIIDEKRREIIAKKLEEK